jgi:hypothetical protein
MAFFDDTGRDAAKTDAAPVDRSSPSLKSTCVMTFSVPSEVELRAIKSLRDAESAHASRSFAAVEPG